MRRIFITGANKGIGLAVARAILTEHADTFVYLGSRSAERGRVAAEELAKERSERRGRIEAMTIDVADDASVAVARQRIGEALGGEKLYGLVNNAGIGDEAGLAAVLATNTLGVRRVCEAFLPIIDANEGRVVNVTSASGPSFVATCTQERQRFFVDSQMTWRRLRAFIDECLATGGDAGALAAMGLGAGAGYGLSKACANSYTMILAREQGSLTVNACTPGFIATDMNRHYAESQGKSPAELGMKSPAEGARAPMHLLFGALAGNGRFYGSDGKRSPLDRYRAPGTAEYSGS